MCHFLSKLHGNLPFKKEGLFPPYPYILHFSWPPTPHFNTPWVECSAVPHKMEGHLLCSWTPNNWSHPSSVVFLHCWTIPSICHWTYFHTSKGHVTWIIQKVNRILTHCGVAYESVRSLSRGHVIRVYNWISFFCHGFNRFWAVIYFCDFEKAYQIFTKAYHMVKEHATWSCGILLNTSDMLPVICYQSWHNWV